MTDDEKPLPDLQDALLPYDALLDYLDELIRTQIDVQVNIKGASRARPAHFQGLQQLREAFANREIHSAQLRYNYQGVQWVDTAMLQEQGARLVRMQAPTTC